MFNFSFIIPVYNRPVEVLELLESMAQLDYDKNYEIVIVEDGSTETSEQVIQKFSDQLNIIKRGRKSINKYLCRLLWRHR